MIIHPNVLTKEIILDYPGFVPCFPWATYEIPDNSNIYEYIYINNNIEHNPEQAKIYWNEYFKNIARDKIKEQVGDDKDLVADLSKRVDWLERALIRLMAHTLNVIPMSEEYQIKYGAFCTTLINMVESGLYTPRADLYDDEQALFEELVSRQNTIGQIVKTEYLNKIII